MAYTSMTTTTSALNMSATDRGPESARRAMGDWGHKCRLLTEERDYYAALFQTSQRAYEDHRRELTHLLLKERESAASRESELEKILADLRSDNRGLEQRIDAARGEAKQKAQADVEGFRHQATDREAAIRNEVQAAHQELMRQRRQLSQVEQDEREYREGIDNLRRRQESLQVRVKQLNDERLLRAAEAQARAASPHRKRTGSATRRPPPFIPAGRQTMQTETSKTTTHNVHALMQTVRSASYRSPPRRDMSADGRDGCDRERGHQQRSAGSLARVTFASDSSGSPTSTRALSTNVWTHPEANQLRAMRRSLHAELGELRTEFDSFTATVGDPAYASAKSLERVRELSQAMQAKQRQIDAVAATQQRLESAFHTAKVLDESERRAKEGERLHDSIIDAVQSKYE